MNNLPNIIFLDFDGVICTNRACLAVGNTGHGFSYLDPIACLLVKSLCEECNAKIVISSSWRLHFDRWAMQAILDANCPNLGSKYMWQSEHWWRTATNVYTDFEEACVTTDRGREIKNWIDNHETKFNNFCILDDMADMRPLQDSLVKCDAYDGLGWHQYRHAEKLLLAEA
jgi:hypothetical protein